MSIRIKILLSDNDLKYCGGREVGMPRMPKADAEKLFQPYGPGLVGCVRGGVDDYFDLYVPRLRAAHSPRTRANIIRDHIIERMVGTFSDVGGVNIIRNASKGRYTLLSVQGRALNRFKYLGRRKRSKNVRTKLARAFTDNQVVIEGFPPQATRFDIGYTWNFLQTAVQSVSISCPTPTGVEYVIDLWNDGAAGQPPLPLPEIGPRDSSDGGTTVVARDARQDTAHGADAAR
jgi:hypothetical protein